MTAAGKTFREVDGRPIRYTDKVGLVHICEGAEVHRGVTLIWTLCERDVPANKAWKLDAPSMHEVCMICLKRSKEIPAPPLPLDKGKGGSERDPPHEA